jgi:hypothetical protein
MERQAALLFYVSGISPVKAAPLYLYPLTSPPLSEKERKKTTLPLKKGKSLL